MNTINLQFKVTFFGFLLFVFTFYPNLQVFSQTSDLQVILNGFQTGRTIRVISTGNVDLLEVKVFTEIMGAQYFPIQISPKTGIYGICIQYGKIISFVYNNFKMGYNNLTEIALDSTLKTIDIGGKQVIFAPINFLEGCIKGKIEKNINNQIVITNSPPERIGSRIPIASVIADSLIKSGYNIRQGIIARGNPIQIFKNGYVPNCNGNNAHYGYNTLLMPPSPGNDTIPIFPAIYTIRADEAIVFIGKTPPKCKYFSYRSYITHRFNGTGRDKLFASLGDSKSSHNMRTDLPVDDMFERDFALISVADSTTAIEVKSIIKKVTNLDEKDIYFDIVPSETLAPTYGFRFGTGITADWTNILCRVSIFEDSTAGANYLNNPTLEILRVSPNQTRAPKYMAIPPYISRYTGQSEFYLTNGLNALEDSIINKYKKEYDIIKLNSRLGMDEGYITIPKKIDALAEIRDVIYLMTDSVQFYENDAIVVYGPNHVKTGKGVYSNFSCYGSAHLNGIGGIDDNKFFGSAREFFQDTNIADYYYIYKIVRPNSKFGNEKYIYVIPEDINKDFTGFDYGDSVFVAYRAYIDTITRVGAAFDEVLFDRALVMRPKPNSVTKISEENYLFNIFPNPANESINISLENMKSEVYNISIFSPLGEEIIHFKYQHLQEHKKFSISTSTFHSGVYYFIFDTGKEKLFRSFQVLK